MTLKTLWICFSRKFNKNWIFAAFLNFFYDILGYCEVNTLQFILKKNNVFIY